MQEKEREISIIKRNILKYAEYKGISRYEIYQRTGISRSVLSQSNGMTEDNLLRFLAYYEEVNPDWLLLGKGSMLRVPVKLISQPTEQPAAAELAKKDEEIRWLREQLKTVNDTNKMLASKVEVGEKKSRDSKVFG